MKNLKFALSVIITIIVMSSCTKDHVKGLDKKQLPEMEKAYGDGEDGEGEVIPPISSTSTSNSNASGTPSDD
jgi:hypothetical protein